MIRALRDFSIGVSEALFYIISVYSVCVYVFSFLFGAYFVFVINVIHLIFVRLNTRENESSFVRVTDRRSEANKCDKPVFHYYY